MVRWLPLVALLLALFASRLGADEQAPNFSQTQKQFKLAFKRLPLQAPAKFEKRLRSRLPRSIEITSAPFDALIEKLIGERANQLDLRATAMAGLSAFPTPQAGRLIQAAFKTLAKEKVDLQKRILEVEEAYAEVYLKGWMEAGSSQRQTRMLAAVLIPFYRHLLARNASLGVGAAVVMAAMNEGAAFEWVLRSAATGKQRALRMAALDALSRLTRSEAEASLRLALAKDADAGVRAAALAGLMRRPLGGVRDAVAKALRDPAWQVRALAIRICLRGRLVDAVEPLVDALEKETGRLRKDIDDALFSLTGVRLYADPKLWRRWLGENREVLVAKQRELEQAGAWKEALGPVEGWAREDDAPKETEREAEARNKKGSSSSFYGIPTWSKRLLFLVDISRSMQSEAAQKPPLVGDAKHPYARPLTQSKMAIARWQLHRVIHDLPEDATCNVLVYSESYKAWQPQMVQLKRKAKKKAHAWIDALLPNGTTNIADPLDKAFELAGAGPLGLPAKTRELQADTIFLLSDGEPNRGRLSVLKELLEQVTSHNARHGLVIHAIGIGAVAGSSFLKDLARRNGGRYVGFP